MNFRNNYLLNLGGGGGGGGGGGSSLGIFRKQVAFTTLLNRLQIDIFLPIGVKRKVQKITMKNVLILLGQRLLKWCMLTPTWLHNLEFIMSHFL